MVILRVVCLSTVVKRRRNATGAYVHIDHLPFPGCQLTSICTLFSSLGYEALESGSIPVLIKEDLYMKYSTQSHFQSADST